MFKSKLNHIHVNKSYTSLIGIIYWQINVKQEFVLSVSMFAANQGNFVHIFVFEPDVCLKPAL
jgi:hypothetical protein